MKTPFAFIKTSGTPAPNLTSLDRDLADTLSDSIIITGTNLASATSVTWGGTAGTITANTSTSLTFTTPAKASGTYNVQVTTAGGSSNTLSLEAWSPVQLTSAAHVYRSDVGITQVTGTVSQWNDQVGTAHLVQGTGANRPTYNSTDASYGNKPSIQSSGTQWLAAASITTSQPCTVWAVGEFSTSGGVFASLDSGGGANAIVYGPSGTLTSNAGSSLSSGIAIGTKKAILAVFNGASSFIGASNWLTGGASGSAGAAGGNALAVLAYGNGTFPTGGKITMFAVQSAAANSTDKTKMAKWVKRFSITVT